MAMASADVTVIVVSYNTKALLRECLASVMRAGTRTVEVIVVDNASADGSADMVAHEFPAVDLIRVPSNVGFAAANNLALRRAQGGYCLLLNPDATLNDDTTEALAAYLDAHGDVGVVGPTVLFPDGRFQSSGFAFPTVLSELRQSRSVEWMARFAGAVQRPAPPGREPLEVDWVDGACLMIRRETMDAIGLLDEQYFLYGEEVDWCYRARKTGWRVVAVRAAAAFHHRGQSTGGVADATVAYLTETRLRFFRTHRGVPTALFVSAVFALGCLKQIAESRIRMGKRTESSRGSRARLNAVWHWWLGRASIRQPLPPRARPAA